MSNGEANIKQPHQYYVDLVKRVPNETDRFNLVKVTKDINTLYHLADNDYSNVDKNVSTSQNGILKNLAYSFYLNGSEKINKLVNTNDISLGDLANCVTGFYSGDNKKFIKIVEPDGK